uniref:histidine kinase n=1 Tax=Rheinheimera sp. BAL341 TaxID=1708203 RepID=A0A486XJT4_9GAMM
MSKSNLSFKHLLALQFVLGALIPALLLSGLLIFEFRGIQTDEQIKIQSAQTEKAVLQLSSELEKLALQLEQLSLDANVALAASSGIFAPNARTSLLKLAAQHPLASAILLVDNNFWVAEAVPVNAMVLPLAPLHTSLSNLYQADYSAHDQTILLDAAEFNPLLTAEHQEPQLSQWILMLLPLKLADTAAEIDPRSKLSGVLVALVSLQQIKQYLNTYSPHAELLNIYWQNTPLLPELPQDIDSVVSRAKLNIPGLAQTLEISFSTSRERALQPITDLTYRFALITALFSIVLLIAAWLFVRREIKPIAELSGVVQRYADGDLTQPQQHFLYAEFEHIASVLHSMAVKLSEHQYLLEGKVRQRTEELQLAVENLNTMNGQLVKTQQHLIEAEKSSQIGILVAGVAREISAPVSKGLQALYLLQQQNMKITNAVKHNALKRSALENYLADSSQAIKQLGYQLKKAEELILSFKAMAVDQSSEQRRNFNLYDYLYSVILNLRYELGHYQVKVDIQGDKIMIIQSLPGSFSRILTNLILNSLQHGFEPQQQHSISISYKLLPDGLLQLTYHDDGAGITPEVQQRMFEPFFTTAQQEGGSGLGLSIVYNLVTQQLKGKVTCHSEPGHGATFILTLPVRVVIKPRKLS